MRFLAHMLRTLAFTLKDSQSALAQTLPVKVNKSARGASPGYRRRRATYGQCAWKVRVGL